MTTATTTLPALASARRQLMHLMPAEPQDHAPSAIDDYYAGIEHLLKFILP